ncbi:MAG: PhzF family phenazine biosynthesis protein [Bacteroidota bacterium]
MKLNIYQVDAFGEKLFSGNPAAVIPLTEWLPVELMQQVALENNLSETVFIVPVPGEPVINVSADPLVITNLVSEEVLAYEIRWFTPEVEVNLCGHATLASAYVLFNILEHPSDTIVFYSASGPLIVTKEGEFISMDFPRWMPEVVPEVPAFLSEALGGMKIISVHQYRDLLVEAENEFAVQNCKPDFALLKQYFDKLIITAPGNDSDFVSRFFAPAAGIDEDPVTGSAHAQLIPFWANRLEKKQMTARQLSHRGGYLLCEDLADRVIMKGKAILYMVGEIYI